MAVGLILALKKICKRQNSSPPPPLSSSCWVSESVTSFGSSPTICIFLQKAPDQKCQKPKQNGWDRLLPGCLAEAGRDIPASEPFCTGGLLACHPPCPFQFSEEAWCTVFPRELVSVPWEEAGMEAGEKNVPEPFF